MQRLHFNNSKCKNYIKKKAWSHGNIQCILYTCILAILYYWSVVIVSLTKLNNSSNKTVSGESCALI